MNENEFDGPEFKTPASEVITEEVKGEVDAESVVATPVPEDDAMEVGGDIEEDINVEKGTTEDIPVETPKVVIEKNYDEPYFVPEQTKHFPHVTMHAPNVRSTPTEHMERLKEYRAVIENAEGSDEKIEAFNDLFNAYQALFTTIFDEGEFDRTFDREGSEWVQSIEGEQGKPVRISNPKFNLDKTADTLEGLNAMRYLSSITGVSTVSRIPCWHSGLVITIDSFKERELLDLNQSLIRNRMDLGNNTKGASFSGDDVYTTAVLLDFIIDHVLDTNLIDWDRTKLRELMLTLDIPAILVGTLAAIYPKGYPLFHQCANVPLNKCNYSITAKRTPDLGDFVPDTMLDFRKTLWVDKTKLSIEDRVHMSKVKPTYTFEEIKAYQMRVNKLGKYESGVSLFKNDETEIFINFKIPSLKTYGDVCSNWCITISDMVDKMLKMDKGLTDEERATARNDALNSYALTLDLLKQSNWIDYIRTTDSSGVSRRIIKAKDIENALEIFSRLEDFNETFTKAVLNFKEDMTFAFTGLPNFECPECHSGQILPGAKNPSLIAINAVSYFFTLMEWRNLTRFAGILT